MTDSRCGAGALEVPELEVLLVRSCCAACWPRAPIQVDQSALLTVAVALTAVGVFFAAFETSRPSLRQVMPTVVLAALAAAGRMLFAPIPDFKPVSAICILAGAVFGRSSGFMVGALAALVSNFFFGQGAVDALADVRLGARRLPGRRAGRPRLARPHAGAARVRLLVGAFVRPAAERLERHRLRPPAHAHRPRSSSFGAALPFDLMHGAATVAFLAALYVPWKKKLERIKKKYALVPDGGAQ